MTTLPKTLAGLGLVAAAALAGACNDFLQVDNPAAVDVARLADSTNAALLINGAIGEFQGMIATTALWGGVLADESRSTHVNVSYGPIDRRDFSNLNDLVAPVYSALHRARFAGDTTAQRLIGYQGAAAAARDLRVARMLAFAGYAQMLLAETFGRSPLDGGATQQPAELWRGALAKLDSAATIARAARVGVTNRAPGDSVLGLALVAAARTAMNLNDRARAAAYAQQVVDSLPNFEYRSYYTEGIPAAAGFPVNPYWNAMGAPEPARTGFNTNQSGGINFNASSLWLVVDSAFIGLNDPRVPMTPTRVTTMGGTAAGTQFVAGKSRSFGGYVAPSTAAPAGAPMTPGASMRVASGLEARYILAETQGGDARTLAFVNQQRAANGQPASTAVAAADVLADLRDQKRREFYLDGHRLGELRRYKAQYNIDQFPRGPQFGTVECWPIPLTELNSNPNATP